MRAWPRLLVIATLALGAPGPALALGMPGPLPTNPSFVQRVEPAVIGLRVRGAPGAFSSTRLGVQRAGRTVRAGLVGLASIRLGEVPHADLAIPTEAFVAVKGELVAAGRVASRPARPSRDLYTVARYDGVVVRAVSPLGPAAEAGFRHGALILRVDGHPVASQAVASVDRHSLRRARG